MPSGTPPVLADSRSLKPSFTPRVSGPYKVTFTACANNSCTIPASAFERRGPVLVPTFTKELTFTAADQLMLPAQKDPPTFGPSGTSFNSPTAFDDVDEKCNGTLTHPAGGGLFYPQWVTVHRWNGPQDYERLEGV